MEYNSLIFSLSKTINTPHNATQIVIRNTKLKRLSNSCFVRGRYQHNGMSDLNVGKVFDSVNQPLPHAMNCCGMKSCISSVIKPRKSTKRKCNRRVKTTISLELKLLLEIAIRIRTKIRIRISVQANRN